MVPVVVPNSSSTPAISGVSVRSATLPAAAPPRRVDTRGPSFSHKHRGGLVLKPADGAYAQVVVVNPATWLELVELMMRMPSVEALRRRMRVAGVPMVMKACREWAAAADHHTGRGVAISHQTVAGRIGYAATTVKRVMRFLSRLGLVVEVVRGANRLTLEQLAEARQLGGVHQRTVASTRALTVPRSVDGTPLPTLETVNETSPVKESPPKRASAHTAGATRRSAMNGVFDLAGSRPRWTPEVQTFAARLVHERPRLLWTARNSPHRTEIKSLDGRVDFHWIGGRHIGQICDAIARLRLVERGWTVTKVLELIDNHRATLRVDIDPAEQRDPLAWLVWLIRRSIGTDDLSPVLQAQRERDEARAQSAARRAADEERRAQIEAERPAIDAILADMHRRFPRRPRRRSS